MKRLANGAEMLNSSWVGVRPPAGRRNDIGNVYVLVWMEHSIADSIFVSNSPVAPDRGIPERSSSELGVSVMTRSFGFSTPMPVMVLVANLDNGFSVNDFIFSHKSDSVGAERLNFCASSMAFIMERFAPGVNDVLAELGKTDFVVVVEMPDRALRKLFFSSKKLCGVSP